MLQRCLLVLLASFSLSAFAGAFDYLPANPGPEKEFQALMNSGNFKHALTVWGTAHRGSSFGQSQNGQATLAYLLYQNGLPVSGLEHLFQSTKAANLHAQLLKLWTVELANSSLVQKGWVTSSIGWKSVVANSPVSVKLATRADIKKAFAQVDAVHKSQMNKKGRILWQIATRAPQIGEMDSALKALKLLRESGQNVIGRDQIDSAYARVLYQKGDLDAALQAFALIPKSSPLWVESVEERAWTHLRRFDLDKALGESITLLSPALVALVGPESYYLTNLLSLKSCDYPRIFKNSELFKTRHTTRLTAMQDLTTKGMNTNLPAVLDRFDKSGVSVESAGPLVEWIPRSSFRDAKFVRLSETRRLLLNEMKTAEKLSGTVDVLGGSQNMKTVSDLGRVRVERLRQQSIQRLRELATTEVKEYRQVLDKMHIIEGEVIHRLAVDDNLKGQRSKLAKVEDTGDVLVFPYKSDEVWFDELDNYKARVKDCPTLQGAAL